MKTELLISLTEGKAKSNLTTDIYTERLYMDSFNSRPGNPIPLEEEKVYEFQHSDLLEDSNPNLRIAGKGQQGKLARPFIMQSSNQLHSCITCGHRKACEGHSRIS